MLWRVRTTLDDRPGALAGLATACGSAGVNILGLQVFPGVDRVTDELVLRAPDDWDLPRLAELVERAGGSRVSVLPCTEAALSDQPTRYVLAARSILSEPASFPDVVAKLFDAETDGSGADLAAVMDGMDLEIGDVVVQVRRTAPFTAAEHARGTALAELVADVLAAAEVGGAPEPHVPPGGQEPTYEVGEGEVHAVVAGAVVGRATWLVDAEHAWHVELGVDPAWRRRGIGSRLLLETARSARSSEADEIVVRTAADNPAVLPLVLGTGLRGRIRMGTDDLTVRIPVRRLART
ncbi:GNAT family N-acetyltransferase [Nocardioides sp. STR2]|jgi:ribosomal protein S18 acetylase RimI-like enzyme|uniref:GNAT family N-acetyltransferase n=1 Tax=Nocardioides pini TaxID=2975053 RepID=A0ABT4CB45_9ACTN|nr:GNAT family N-acetyltransferase [Nocardioides pini]MCY4725189.1 GNAT family N-acetyltransferase [Nocardioides pini]